MHIDVYIKASNLESLFLDKGMIFAYFKNTIGPILYQLSSIL